MIAFNAHIHTNYMINIFCLLSTLAASLKSLGDKASGLFERKKKEAGDMAGEKASTAKKLAEDQVKKTTDAISGATSGAQGLIGGITDDAKSGAKDVQKKAGERADCFALRFSSFEIFSGDKADSIESSIEEQIVQANQSASKAAGDLNNAKDDAVEKAAVKIDNAKQESLAQADLVKAGANTAIDQGLKAAENAVDDQLRGAEKIIDEKMQTASKAVDEKIAEANKYADAKRQELTHVSLESPTPPPAN